MCCCFRVGMGGVARKRGSVFGDLAIGAVDLPVPGGAAVVELDFGKRRLCSRAVGDDFGGGIGLYRNQVLGGREQEDIRHIIIGGHAPLGLSTDPGDAQRPTLAKGPIATSGTVDKAQRRLKAATTPRDRNGNGEVPGSRLDVGGEALTYARYRTTTRG